jgi:hypothetical protein
MKAFTDTRRVLWISGVFLLFAGLLAAFVILPASREVKTGPDIHLPKMENVPPPDAPRLGVETGKE